MGAIGPEGQLSPATGAALTERSKGVSSEPMAQAVPSLSLYQTVSCLGNANRRARSAAHRASRGTF